jgi:hypothetical protein
MLLFSSGLYATCVKKDIVGIWHANLHAVVSPSKDSQHLLFRCVAVVNTAGAITRQSKCEAGIPALKYLPVPVQGGVLSVNSICKVSGHLKVLVGSVSVSLPIDQAWLSKGKDVLSGEGVYDDGWLTLNAIKQ